MLFENPELKVLVLITKSPLVYQLVLKYCNIPHAEPGRAGQVTDFVSFSERHSASIPKSPLAQVLEHVTCSPPQVSVGHVTSQSTTKNLIINLIIAKKIYLTIKFITGVGIT